MERLRRPKKYTLIFEISFPLRLLPFNLLHIILGENVGILNENSRKFRLEQLFVGQ